MRVFHLKNIIFFLQKTQNPNQMKEKIIEKSKDFKMG